MSHHAGISLDVDGTPTDIAKVSWAEVAPCGCVGGLTVAWLPSPYTLREPVVTAEQAQRAFSGSTKMLAQDVRRGFTVKPVLLEQSRELMKNCEHDPKWGYQRPTPEGMVWALSARWAGASVLLHLIPAANADGGPTEYVKPLCGGKASVTWTAERPWTMDHADCERCIKAVAP